MTAETLAKTPLHALHLELGAKMVPFAGYDMPVQYPAGVLKEHLHTREQAGLFDVSHMGQIRLVGADAALALESLVPVDILDLLHATAEHFAERSGSHRAGHADLALATDLGAGDRGVFLVEDADRRRGEQEAHHAVVVGPGDHSGGSALLRAPASAPAAGNRRAC